MCPGGTHLTCEIGILLPPLLLVPTIPFHLRALYQGEAQSQEGADNKVSQPNPTPGRAGLGKAGYTGATWGMCCHHAGEAISCSPKGNMAIAVGMMAPGLDLGSKAGLLEGAGGHQEGTAAVCSLWWLCQIKHNFSISPPGGMIYQGPSCDWHRMNLLTAFALPSKPRRTGASTRSRNTRGE